MRSSTSSCGRGWATSAMHQYSSRSSTRHVEEVVASVPADKLLVFDVQQGWRPLCEFLDIDPPAVPFPRVNEREVLERSLALDGGSLLDALRGLR